MRKDRIDRPRDEGVFVPPIEKEKEEKGKFRKLEEKQQKRILAATFFSYLEKIFAVFGFDKEMSERYVSKIAIVEHLETFKGLLQRLQNEDLSKDIAFATALSNCWSKLLESEQALALLEKKETEKTISFRTLLDSVRHFPKNAEHTLGFYLLEHAGKDWLPFPFIEILANLNSEHQKSLEKSQLKKWDSLINEAIALLNKRLLPS